MFLQNVCMDLNDESFIIIVNKHSYITLAHILFHLKHMWVFSNFFEY